MAIHDAYARLTPYELLLPDTEFADRHFPAVADEAGERGVDPANPAAFVMLGAVQAALAELREDDASPQSANDHGSVLYFAYRMWLAGPAVALVRAGTLRPLLAAAPETAPTAQPPQTHAWTRALHERAGYVQLPQHLVWLEEGDDDNPGDRPPDEPPPPHPAAPAGVPSHASGTSPTPGTPATLGTSATFEISTTSGTPATPETPAAPGTSAAPDTPPAPESVDGLFWAVDPGGILHLALVTGVRADRPGYGIVPVPPQSVETLPEWAAGPAREGGGDFTTALPGADLDGLLGVRTPAEVFKLAALVLGLMARERPALHPPKPASPSNPASPPATTLPSALL